MNPNDNQGASPQPVPGSIPPQSQAPSYAATPQPEQPVIGGGGFPSATQPPAGAARSMPPVSGQSGGKRPLIITLVVVAVLLIGGVAGLLLAQKAKNTGTGSTGGGAGVTAGALSSELTALSHYGSGIKSSDLSNLNKDTLFYAVFKNAAKQSVVRTKFDNYEGAGPNDQTTRHLEYLYNTAFDYKTKALSLVSQNPDGSYITECSNGKQYNYTDSTDFTTNTTTWSWQPTQEVDCDMSSYVYNISDGFSVGGLNETQAQSVVSGLSGAKGLINVQSMSLVTHNGAPYIRLAVTVNPINLGADNGYEGLGVFEGEVKNAGIDPLSWPYGTIGSLGTGAQIIYYVNPATQLPAYSQIGLTYSIENSTGKQISDTSYDFRDSEYSFGGTVTPPSTTAAPQSVKLGWPEEKM